MSKQNPKGWFGKHVPKELLDTSIFKFKIKLTGDTVIELDLTKDLDVEYERLEEQLSEVPSEYIYWAAIYSEARSLIPIMERKVAMRRASLCKSILDAAVQSNKKTPTDKQIAMLIEGDQTLNKLEIELVLANKNSGKLYHMVEAIKMKSENSRSLAGFKREDHKQSAKLT